MIQFSLLNRNLYQSLVRPLAQSSGLFSFYGGPRIVIIEKRYTRVYQLVAVQIFFCFTEQQFHRLNACLSYVDILFLGDQSTGKGLR